MRALLAAGLVLLASPPARPCGGGFGEGIVVDPDQTIVVSWTGHLGSPGGIETYVMQPYYCGAAAQLGLIMPLPSPLTEAPSQGDPALVTELEALTQPTVQRECRPSGVGCGGALKTGADDGDAYGGGFDPGVNVIDTGRVGILDYTLLQATSARAFTDWLDASQFPHDPSSDPVFESYVSQSWYFVAFKVSAGADAPPPGSKLCGTVGPLVLRFVSDATPVVPARIAAVNQAAGGPPAVWRVFTLSSEPLQPSPTSQFLFSGAVSNLGLSHSPTLAAFVGDMAYVTKANVTLAAGGPTDDIDFSASTWPDEYRHVTVEYEDCGCAASSNDLWQGLIGALLLLQAPLFWRRLGGRRARLAAARGAEG